MENAVPVVGSIVDSFKKDLEDYLLTQGFKPIVRRCEEGCEIIQYVKGRFYDSGITGIIGLSIPIRQSVPLLIADIGAVTFEKLTIVCDRTTNKPLHDKILELFDKYSIEAKSFSQNPNDLAYELRRI